MDWSDTEIKQNREWLRRDKDLSWELAQREAMGPNWREQLEAAAEATSGMAEPGMGGGMDLGAGGMPGMGTAEAPPAFGAPPPVEGGAEPAPAPVAGAVGTALP